MKAQISTGIRREFEVEFFADDGTVELTVYTIDDDKGQTTATSVTQMTGEAARTLAQALVEAADALSMPQKKDESCE